MLIQSPAALYFKCNRQALCILHTASHVHPGAFLYIVYLYTSIPHTGIYKDVYGIRHTGILGTYTGVEAWDTAARHMGQEAAAEARTDIFIYLYMRKPEYIAGRRHKKVINCPELLVCAFNYNVKFTLHYVMCA